MTLRAPSSLRSTLLLSVLLGLTSCASAPKQLTQVEVREVPVPVRTPLPDECFNLHLPAPAFTNNGPLTLRQLDDWLVSLVQSVQQYTVQAADCGELNKQRK